MGTPEASTHTVDEQFAAIWAANHMGSYHAAVIAGRDALVDQQLTPEAIEPTVVYVTDVTLRDGQQQRTDPVTVDQRVEVFDHIIDTGVDRIEIGHLGNPNGDRQLAAALVGHIAKMEQDDPRYANVKMQVLFGSQAQQITEGIAVLEQAFEEHYGDDWRDVMADKMVIHVYDRVDENLTKASSVPYDQQESAARVSAAAQHAIDAGFTQFSISAEAATAVTPEDALQFYRSVTQYLVDQGAQTINVNLANTYGYSANANWNPATLTIFNGAVKHGFEPGVVTTSIHTHNDVDNAVDVATDAIVAGFDRVEGTIIGMGERAGNVGNTDVVARLLEAARHDHEATLGPKQSAIADYAGRATLRRMVRLAPGVVEGLSNTYASAEAVAEIFGEHAQYRWRRSAIGNPYSFDNGSGPHDQLMAAAVRDPEAFPPYRNYEWALTVGEIVGRPLARALALGDPDAVRQVTVNNHMGGGSTARLTAGEVQRADTSTIARAEQNFDQYLAAVIGRVSTGALLVA